MLRIGLTKFWIINLSALILFAADRIIKNYFLNNPAQVFGGDFLLSFGLVKNAGIAFGIIFNQIVLLFFIIIIILILVSFLIKAYQEKNSWQILSLTLILVGAFSNLLDRIYYQSVIDYINLRWFTVFNLADCGITVGVVILLLDILKHKKTS